MENLCHQAPFEVWREEKITEDG
ncbi:hypothetical protein J4Q44_G00000240 [Coregonus suidteri]|uniref:Uncharacterized protein n=1 Tax=Coregonus suidteri TaxID=861788 RepID=A0AAN8MJ63_9TELE